MAGSEPSLGQLVSQATADVQSLVRNQIELTKLEVSASAKEVVGDSAMLIAAGVLSLIGFIFLLVTAAYGLVQLGLAPWLGFLIVAVIVLIVAAILAIVGRNRLQKVKGPEKAMQELKATRESLSSRSRAAVGSSVGSAESASDAAANVAADVAADAKAALPSTSPETALR